MIQMYQIIELLSEQARRQNDFEDKFTEKVPEVIKHLIKIFMWREHRSLNHWIDEVENFTIRVPLLKNNKYPKKELIYKVLWVESENRILNTYYKEVLKYTKSGGKYCDMGKKSLTGVEQERLLSFIKDYSDWVSTELSKEGTIVDKADEKIKELLSKYKLEG